MGVGKEQPGILESMGGKSSKSKTVGEGGGGVNTLTGSVEVAASQSNTVIQRAGPGCPSLEDNLSSVNAMMEKDDANQGEVQVRNDSDASPIDDSDDMPDDASKPAIPGAGQGSPGDSL